MALDGKTMGILIKNWIDQVDAPEPGASQVEIEKYRNDLFEAMGQAIVLYIQSNAQVTGIVVTGVMSGGSTAAQLLPGQVI